MCGNKTALTTPYRYSHHTAFINTYTQIYMAVSIFCLIIVMSLNVARHKSKLFSCLPLTIIWPSPLECTHRHTHMPHTRRLLYNKAITIKAVRAGVLSITAEKLHLSHPARHRVTCKQTRAQAICPNTHQ